MGKIFYIMGKSASGKDSIYRKLKDCFPKLRSIVLYTTRPIREGEVEGVEYHFTNREQFDQMCNNGKIIEYRSYDTMHGEWIYFTADDGQIDLERESYLVIGTLVSYKKMQEYFGEQCLVPIYIEVEDGERLTRALEREKLEENPKYAELCRRFLADQVDFSEEHLEEAGITIRYKNDNVDKCIQQIVLGIQNELCYNQRVDCVHMDKTDSLV